MIGGHAVRPTGEMERDPELPNQIEKVFFGRNSGSA